MVKQTKIDTSSTLAPWVATIKALQYFLQLFSILKNPVKYDILHRKYRLGKNIPKYIFGHKK